MTKYIGGVITKDESKALPENGFEGTSANGVWNLNEQLMLSKQSLWPTVGVTLQRGLFAGGDTGSLSNIVDFIDIASAGNATDFGDLSSAANFCGGLASATRGCIALGSLGSGTSNDSDTIEFFTIASTGNATDFGNFSDDDRVGTTGISNNTRGIFGGGQDSNFNRRGEMLFITIASTGNSSNFGELNPSNGTARMAGCASTTRGIFGGGQMPDGFGGSTAIDVIQFVTIGTTGNATDFGDLTVARQLFAGCSSSTRGIFGGGNPDTDTIDFITIASTGNATDFGNLLSSINALSACSSSIRGVFGGGDSTTDVIQFVTIGTTGNASDFGDLTAARKRLTACSSGHGGI